MTGENGADLPNGAVASLEKFFLAQRQGLAGRRAAGQTRCRRSRSHPRRCARSNGFVRREPWLVFRRTRQTLASRPRKYLVVARRVAIARAIAGLFGSRSRSGALRPLSQQPVEPYWPHYEGDVDARRRKPAYHQRTAWGDVDVTGSFLCEALARRDVVPPMRGSPEAVDGGKGISRQHGTIDDTGCSRPGSGNSGMATHRTPNAAATHRLWGVTEALRVWRLLGNEIGVLRFALTCSSPQERTCLWTIRINHCVLVVRTPAGSELKAGRRMIHLLLGEKAGMRGTALHLKNQNRNEPGNSNRTKAPAERHLNMPAPDGA